MSDIQDVLKEMRDTAKEIADADIPGFGNRCTNWADAFETAMREPVVTLQSGDPYDEREGIWLSQRDLERLSALGPGTKLFTLLPAASGEIERLTMERDNARSIVEAATREGLLAQALADIKRLTEALREIDNRIDWEINPSNYDHDQVCKMNAEWCEVGNIAQAALNTEGKLT